MKKNKLKKFFKAFTLVELIIVITIVIVLSTISVPLYRGHIKKAKLTEGYALLALIRDAQREYYSEYRNFLFANSSSAGSIYPTCNETVLGIDARVNKYFTAFCVAGWSSDLKFCYTAYATSKDAGRLAFLYDITAGVNFS